MGKVTALGESLRFGRRNLTFYMQFVSNDESFDLPIIFILYFLSAVSNSLSCGSEKKKHQKNTAIESIDNNHIQNNIIDANITEIEIHKISVPTIITIQNPMVTKNKVMLIVIN